MIHLADTDEFVAHSKAAKIRGVSTKTLDRWADAGIIQPPEKINGRKYHKLRALLKIEEAV